MIVDHLSRTLHKLLEKDVWENASNASKTLS